MCTHSHAPCRPVEFRGQFSGVSSSHLVEPEARTQVVNLDAQGLYLKSHLTNLYVFFSFFSSLLSFYSFPELFLGEKRSDRKCLV